MKVKFTQVNCSQVQSVAVVVPPLLPFWVVLTILWVGLLFASLLLGGV